MSLDIPINTTISEVITDMAAALSALKEGMFQELLTWRTKLA